MLFVDGGREGYPTELCNVSIASSVGQSFITM